MEYLWIGLILVVIFLMYMWFRGGFPSAEPRPSCSTCPGKKNVPSVE